MSITGPGSITASILSAQNNMFTQLNTLSEQLSTGEAAQTYAGLNSQAGLALELNAQLSAITGYSNTATAVGTTLSIAQSVLGQLSDVGNSVAQSITDQGTFSLDSNGQTSVQESAASYLDQVVSLLNTQVGGNYLFSGSAVNQPSVASANAILNGNGAQAGLTQLIAQRAQADGVGAQGRLEIPSVATGSSTVSISQDAGNSTFGFQLAGVSSSLTGATVAGPSGTSPPSISIDLGSNPNNGDSISFDLTLPDGSSQTITLTATTSSPGANQFSIGADADATAANLQAALSSAVSSLANTALPAASATAAANNFFSIPPQIVDATGSPPDYATATSLTDGTSANTVLWYTGANSSTPLQTATAQVGPSMTVAYGMQANEPAITSLLANVAVLAATTYSTSDSNAQASYQALCQSVSSNLASQSGTQSISDIEAQIANAQSTAQNATALNTQTQNALNDLLQGIDGVNQDQLGEQILTLQNTLSASMSVTARLAQLSLVNYLAPVNG
jgi:flagellar hook-associated protein 3 FlgL